VLGDLPDEVRRPVGDPAAERLAPLGVVDRAARGGQVVEAGQVAVDPRADPVAVASPDQRLDRHRPVVGEPVLAPFRTPPMHPQVRLVKPVISHATSLRRPGPAVED